MEDRMNEEARFLFISNFNTERETIYFGYMIDKMFIRKGYIVLELLFEKRVEAMSAYNNIAKYIQNTELTKVVSLKKNQLEIEVEAAHFWHSISTKKRVILEIKMPR